jgi:predicted component of type VI protein secretion system
MASEAKTPDQMIEAKYRAQMQSVVEALDETFNGTAKHPNKKVGFVLLVFEYGTREGRANYLSNGADRKDIVALFKEMIARFEGQPEMTGRG